MSDPKENGRNSIDSDNDKTLVRPIKPNNTAMNPDDQPGPSDRTQIYHSAQAHRSRPTEQFGQHTGLLSSSTATTGSGTGTGSNWEDPAMWASQPSPKIAVGVRVKDRFRLEELLGEGGMGVVYRAIDERKLEAEDQDPYVAIKIISESFLHHPESLKALQRESKKTQKLPHKNIVSVYDFDREGNRAFMTMELLVGQSLKEVIRDNPNGLAPDHAVDIIIGICEALAFAHSYSIVHSDLKPGNVFLTKDNIVKVFDFGIARAALGSVSGDGETTLFDPGVLGALTPAYASYEMLNQSKPVTQDDIYALGCIAYELFTGRHPFNKIRATEAHDKGLSPKQIQCLNKRQWKGLKKALAFKKKDRIRSVEKFQQEITAKPPIGHKIALCVAIALIIAAVTLKDPIMDAYRNYREQLQVQHYIEIIMSGDDAQISRIASKISALGYENRRDITSIDLDVGKRFLDHFKRQANGKFDPAQQRFDYPGAKEVLNLAMSFYPDSNRLNELGEQLEDRKNKLLSSLTSRFNTYLQQGKILPDMEDEDVFNIMSKVRLVDAEHLLLNDKRLESTYVKETEKAILKKDIKRAEKLVALGNSLFKTNKALMNFKGQLENLDRLQRAETEIAFLAKELVDLEPKLNSREAVVEAARKLKRLKDLKPDHQLINRYEPSLGRHLTASLDQLIQEKKWQNSKQLLASMEGLLEDKAIEELKEKLEKRLNAFEEKVGQTLTQFNLAIQYKRLASPSENNASELVSRLERMIPGDIRIQRCYTQIAKAYLALSEKAKEEKDWDKALYYVDKAGQQKLDGAMLASLETARQMIDQARNLHQKEIMAQQKIHAKEELEKLQQIQKQQEIEKQERILALHQAFTNELGKMETTESSAGKVLDIIDNLSILNPEDPLLSLGKKQIENAFIKHAGTLRDGGELQSALETIQTGLKVMPDANSLVAVKIDLEKQLEKNLLQERQIALESFRQQAEKMLARTDINDAWLTKMQDIIKQSGDFEAGNAWLKDLNTRVTAKILARVALEREQEMFASAWALLSTTSRFDKRHSGIGVERRLLKSAESEFNNRIQKEARLAEIDGLKQTLLTRARNNEVEKSRLLYDNLKAELPENDEFLEETAPNAIADAYLRLADKRFDREDITGAIEFVKLGLQMNPDHAPLKNELKKLEKKEAERMAKQTESDRKELISLVDAGNIEKAEQLLSELKKNLPANDPFITTRAPRVIGNAYVKAARTQTGQNDIKGALETVRRGLAFNPGHDGLKTEQNRLQAMTAEQQSIEKEKQSFFELVESGDADAAFKLYKALKQKLPANDKFITKTGPDSLAEAYLAKTLNKNGKKLLLKE